MMRKYVLVLLALTFGSILSLTSPIKAESPRPQEFRGNIIVDGNPTPPGSIVIVRTGGIQIASVITDAKGRYGFNSPLLVSASSGALLEFYVNGAKARETATCKSGEVTLLNLNIEPGSGTSIPNQAIQQPAVSALSGNYTILNLNISPSSVNPGEPVTITAEIKNNSSGTGNFKVTVMVNGITEIEQSISLGTGKTQKLIYTMSKETPGNYNVMINDRNGIFSVVSPSPSWFGWLTSMQWWVYAIAGIFLVLIILIVILVISRRNASYF